MNIKPQINFQLADKFSEQLRNHFGYHIKLELRCQLADQLWSQLGVLYNEIGNQLSCEFNYLL